MVSFRVLRFQFGYSLGFSLNLAYLSKPTTQ